MSQDTPAQMHRKRKSVLLAVALQCLPLLEATGCVFNAVNMPVDRWIPDNILFWGSLVSSLCWGLGYRYLGLINHFAKALVAGVVVIGLAFLFGIFAVLELLGPQVRRGSDLSAGPYVLLGILGMGIAVATLCLAIHAWMLARAHNAALDHADDRRERPEPDPASNRG